MFAKLLNELAAEFDGESLLETVTALHAGDRWFTSSAFARTAEFAADEMRQAGLHEVEIMAFPADGKTLFGDWVMPLAWEADEASVRVVDPPVQTPVLADRSADPCAVVQWCAPTPPQGMTADLVAWDDLSPAQKETLDLHDKFVYSDVSPANVKPQVARGGALGLISGYHGPAGAGPEGTFWQNSWSDHGGWAMTAADDPLVGFMLAADKAAWLRGLLKTGRSVRVHAVARTRLYEGNVLLVTGVLPGATREEVAILGHLFEQGAADNATGAATILHAARVLCRCMPRPRRTLRFLLTSECYSTLPFAVTRREVLHRMAAALNVDMLSPWDDEPAVVEVVHNPQASVSFTDPLLEWIVRDAFAAESLPFELVAKPYGVADNLLADPYLGVPTPMLSSVSRTYWHNSADTPSRLQPRVLHTLAVAATTWLAFLADAGTPVAEWLTERLATEAVRRIRRATWESQAYATGREAARLLSVASLCPDDPHMRRAVEAAATAVRQLAPPESPANATTPEERLVPVRRCPAPLTLPSVSLAERNRFPSPLWSAELNCALYWADGRRTIADIQRLVKLERAHRPVSLVEWFLLLGRHGYVDFRPPA